MPVFDCGDTKRATAKAMLQRDIMRFRVIAKAKDLLYELRQSKDTADQAIVLCHESLKRQEQAGAILAKSQQLLGTPIADLAAYHEAKGGNFREEIRYLKACRQAHQAIIAWRSNTGTLVEIEETDMIFTEAKKDFTQFRVQQGRTVPATEKDHSAAAVEKETNPHSLDIGTGNG